MSIVMISESLLKNATAKDGRILRDRVLSGFIVKLNARRRTFRVATSVAGKQFRMTLGYWPLLSVDEARTQAMGILRLCRQGVTPARKVQLKLPTLRVALVEKLRLGDAVLRRILNHAAPNTDVLHRHYVGLDETDVAGSLVQIQESLLEFMKDALQCVQAVATHG